MLLLVEAPRGHGALLSGSQARLRIVFLYGGLVGDA
jgi:hypothetical protein